MDKIFVVGAGGQDGKIISKILQREYIIGFYKNLIVDLKKNQNYTINQYSKELIFDVVEKYKPEYLYYFASYHHSSEEKPEDDLNLIEKSNFTHFILYGYFLEALREYSPHTKVFYSASSLIFGNPACSVQDELTPINPICIYGITKAEGLFLGRYYRNKYGLFISNGILYNHESEYRSDRFLFPKVIKTAIDIKNRRKDKLLIGDLSSINDWGYAYDYVNAMIKILNLNSPDDFIIATGEGHTVKEFLEIVFSRLGLDYRDYILQDERIIVRKKPVLIGNPRKLIEKTGWQRSVSFKEMIIKIMEDIQ